MQDSASGEGGSFMTVPIDRTFSDGDASLWPTEARYRKVDDRYYRQKMAEQWLKEMKAAEEGVEYILDKLPEGYGLFDRPRGTDPRTRDRFVFGHPGKQYFQSTNQFWPHFLYLMTGGAQPCACILCQRMNKRNEREKDGTPRTGRPSGKPLGRPYGKPSASVRGSGKPIGGRPAGRPVGRPAGSRPVGRPVGWRPANRIVDKEGTPDVYKTAIIKLKQSGRLDQEIEEPESMDWRAERARLEEYLEKLNMQPSYVPRAGEIVLWTSSLDGELAWNKESNCLQIYSPTEDRWLGTPEWRAGIIGQIPQEDIILQDLIETAPKEWNVNYSGFRVETFPDPLSFDKSYSLHSKYVHLRCIKPFNAYELFLQGIPRKELHPSIEHALTVMSSFSLLDQYHIKGTWPNATVYCRGIFIGSELLVVGDAVRLKPKGYRPESPAKVVDVMVIDEIQLELLQCVDDIKSAQLAENYRVRIKGKIYTTDTYRNYETSDKMQDLPSALSHDEVVSAFQRVGMSGYGAWYRAHSGKAVIISQDMMIGRFYEPDATKLLFGSLNLASDLHGVMTSREYSRAVDERIPEGKHWFWGDYRTQTLAIDSLNGEDVGQYSDARDVKMWRANLKVLDGKAGPSDLRDARIPGDVGRPATKSCSSFAEVRKTSTLVSTGLGATDASNTVSSAEEGSARPVAGEAEEEESSEDDFAMSMQYMRGGTEETEGGDYVPDKEPLSKRPRPNTP